jgi:3-hydroxy-9,10-secoandrosta-1,3,5(10)-triene-9,17-dione monooxygenase reductase component
MASPDASTATAGVTGDELRAAIGHFTTGVTVVTSVAPDGEPVGTTVSAVSSLSLDPPLLLVCLDRRSNTLAAVQSHGAFAVNVLAHDHHELSNGFARSGNAAAWEGVEHRPGHTGSPHIQGVSATLECVLEHQLAGGDHEIVVGRVVGLAHDEDREPLVYHRGKYRAITEHNPDGIDRDDRALAADEYDLDRAQRADRRQSREAELRAVEAELPTAAGEFRVLAHERASELLTAALVLGDPSAAEAPLVYAHHACLLGDVFGSLACDCADRLAAAQEEILAAGTGVILYTKPAARAEIACPAGSPIDGPVAAGLLRRIGVEQITLLDPRTASAGALREAGVDLVDAPSTGRFARLSAATC